MDQGGGWYARSFLQQLLDLVTTMRNHYSEYSAQQSAGGPSDRLARNGEPPNGRLRQGAWDKAPRDPPTTGAVATRGRAKVGWTLEGGRCRFLRTRRPGGHG